MNISQKTIEHFKNLVFKTNVEVCGNLRKSSSTGDNTSDGTLVLTNMIEGKMEEYDTGKFRGVCTHEIITSIIFHTHPVNLYAYPSVEDIIKVTKHHGRIVRSIIATKWGLWDIKNTDKSNKYSVTCHDAFVEYIKYFVDRIGRYTSQNSYIVDHGGAKSRDISDKDLVIINDSIERIEKFLHLKINLHLWTEIEKLPFTDGNSRLSGDGALEKGLILL